MARDCGTYIASELTEGFARATRKGLSELMAIPQATELSNKLSENGVGKLHLYTMNCRTVMATI